MIPSGESIRVVHPLFQVEGGGSTPTSPLQLHFDPIAKQLARNLVATWHSRLPEITNWQNCNHCFGASFENVWFAAAMWGNPVAREYNGRGYIELRRFAISGTAPKNTASRMLGWMLRQLRNTGLYCKAISYQDTDVHAGTIYKASGWKIGGTRTNIGTGWTTRDRPAMQSASDKVRWEYCFAGIAGKTSSVGEQGPTQTTNMELFADPASGSI